MQIQKPKQGYKLVRSLSGKYEEIPKSWEFLPIFDICKIRKDNDIKSKLYIGLEHIGQGTNTLVSQGNVNDFTSNKNIFHKGDILYGKLRPLLNKVWLSTEDGYCSTDILVLQVNEKILNSILVKILSMKKFLLYAVSTSSGTKMPRTNWSDIKNFEILIPSIPEQQKISSILSNVDSLIQQTQKIIEQTQSFKKGLMQRLLIKGIGHTKFKQLDIFPKYLKFDIPESWQIVNFGDVSERITYGFTNPMPDTDDGPWMITATNIKNGRIDYTTARQTDWKSYKELLSDKSRPKMGTVLITKDGTLGEVAIVDKENLCINQSVASLEPKKSKITSEFLSMTLQSTLTKKLIEVFSPATTIRHISITDLAGWKFGLPPTDEQQKIVSILSTCELSLQSVKNYRYALESLKKGLMQKLLTGQIRVKV